MRFAYMTVALVAAAVGVQAQRTSGSGYYVDIRDGSAVGYQYTQKECTAPTTKDNSGHVWRYVDTTGISDGASNFQVPLLRRDDTGEFILFFPGSKDFSNFQQDAQTALVNYPFCYGCQVHQGFYTGWLASRTNVTTMLKRNMVSPYQNYNLVIAGGSLGGALASLAYAEFKANSSIGLAAKTVRGYSVGQPRTGNFLYAKFFNTFTQPTSQYPDGKWLRVTHGYDAIVRTPAVAKYSINATPDNIYQHHGTEIWEQDAPVTTNGGHPSSGTTYVCANRSDQSENASCAQDDGPANPFKGNPGDHLTYAGFEGPPAWENVTCGAQ